MRLTTSSRRRAISSSDWSAMVSTLSRRHLIGKCVYCGSTDLLTDEHAIPQGIGGKIVLELGSCEECRRSIHKFEDFVLSVNLGPAKHALGISGKPGAKARFNIGVRRPDETRYVAKVSVQHLPVHSYAVISYPQEPWALLPPNGLRDERRLVTAQTSEIDCKTQVANYGGTFEMKVHDGHFPRTLAKIAHCVTVAHLGVDGFEPFLGHRIKNGCSVAEWRQWVGAGIAIAQPAFHHEEPGCGIVVTGFRVMSPAGQSLWAVNLHILRELNIAPYGVIVGQCFPD